jgi:hypothetical protein
MLTQLQTLALEHHVVSSSIQVPLTKASVKADRDFPFAASARKASLTLDRSYNSVSFHNIRRVDSFPRPRIQLARMNRQKPRSEFGFPTWQYTPSVA